MSHDDAMWTTMTITFKKGVSSCLAYMTTVTCELGGHARLNALIPKRELVLV